MLICIFLNGVECRFVSFRIGLNVDLYLSGAGPAGGIPSRREAPGPRRKTHSQPATRARLSARSRLDHLL